VGVFNWRQPKPAPTVSHEHVGRKDDDVVYEIERQPPYRVVKVQPLKGDTPVTPALVGMPAGFIVKILEPELPTFLEQLTGALAAVKPGKSVILNYRSARYGSTVRIAEVVDRGPDHEHIYVFCRSEKPYGLP
jgi:hypothetical protein